MDNLNIKYNKTCEELNNSNSYIYKLESEISEIKEKYNKEYMAQRVINEIQDLEQKLEVQKHNLSEMKNKNADLSSGLKHVEDELASSEANNSELTQKNYKKESIISNLMKDLENAKNVISLKESELFSTKKTIHKLEGDQLRAEENILKEREEVIKLEKHVKKLKEEKVVLKQEIMSIKVTLKNNQNEFSKKIEEKETLLHELENANLKAANILGAQSLSMDEFIEGFKERLNTFEKKDFQAANSDVLLELAVKLNDSFKRQGLVTPLQAEEVPDHLKHINNIESIIDLYTQKMQRVKVDEALDDEEREMKLENWQRLMDKQVAEMEG